ncbi:MAG TPA: PQQ-binding-like beta-propeller repeat protein, partial [Polyangia bacterium]
MKRNLQARGRGAGLLVLLSFAIARQASATDKPTGASLYAGICMACHGSDGDGGERGPSILEPKRLRTRSADEIRSLIRDGIPGTAMPAFPLPEADLGALAAHVSALIAPAINHAPAGDAEAGARFFFGSGGCVRCHQVNGRGGHLGPALSNLGRQRSLARIEQALQQPGSRRARGYDVVSVRLHNGKALRGLLKNESNHDLQILDLEGGLHGISAAEVATLTREPKSLMPAVRATPAEMTNLLAFLSRLRDDGAPRPGASAAPAPNPKAAFAALARPARGDWPTYHGQLGGNRHSPLTAITRGNVAGLSPRWMFPIPGGRALQTTPLVVGGIMYVSAPNEAFALDARTGRQLWHHSRPRTKGLAGDAARGINRGLALLGDRLFMVTDHAHLIALDRSSGHLLWDVTMADHRVNYGTTSAPLVVDDLVITGNSGGDEGTRGFIAAYRADTGAEVWRFWTVPAPGEPASETWKGNAMARGCAAAWLTGTYDLDNKLLYWTTGNPCPDHDGSERLGDNLYSNSVLALDPSTGQRRWHYQFTPHDLHDWDASQTPLLIDTKFGGTQRSLLAQANRNGFFYVFDRRTGQRLLSQPFVKKLTWASGIGADGRPQRLPDQE